jgi:hypothetical protein
MSTKTNRIYYTNDKALLKGVQLRLHKDIEACLRCGFTLEMISLSLTRTDNEYKDIINLGQ